MDLKYINVCPQALHAFLNSIEYMFARETNTIDHSPIVDACLQQFEWRFIRMTGSPSAFGHDHDVFAGNFIRDKGFSDDFFRTTVGIEVRLQNISFTR